MYTHMYALSSSQAQPSVMTGQTTAELNGHTGTIVYAPAAQRETGRANLMRRRTILGEASALRSIAWSNLRLAPAQPAAWNGAFVAALAWRNFSLFPA